ncbi:UMP kinase [Candidatus Woesearchaeota archaeon]|nr:UMP kinase [Candidatus Woesearchaeota archaeon]
MRTIILSVGGSLIVPDSVDAEWLIQFRKLLLSFLPKAFRFIIIAGGGKTARKYQQAARSIVKLSRDDLDWIGIHCTRLNAHLLRTIFRKESYARVVKNPTKRISTHKRIIVASGWKPGCSTDYDAVLLAKNLGIKKLVNLTNIDKVYDKDPNKFRNAKPIDVISWRSFRKIVGNKWDPGLNAPFDPVAARAAQALGIEVAIINGRNLNNLKKYLALKPFIGTVIKD